MKVEIDNNVALELLMKRVEYWANGCQNSDEITTLFERMYESYIESGTFEGMQFDVMHIVDNDYVNNCRIVEKGESEFKKLLKVYKRQGLGDCSCENCGFDFIEAVDDEDAPSSFLVRH